MKQHKFNWKRYWYPRGSSIQFLDGGYLYKPDNAWSHLINSDVVPLESLAEVPCLVLLGEPGIGKSSELEYFEAYTRNVIGAPTLRFDLKGYQTEFLLQEELFRDPAFQSWIAGTYQLHLFLDGLDEGLLTISVLASLLARNLKKCPLSRLYLRITCRTADWPSSLEEDLRQKLWSKDKVAVYQLAPLRREDVAEAAAAALQKLHAEQFLAEVDLQGAVPLASKPLTLQFLLNTYRNSKTFPATQEQLYHDGLLLLCEEQNPYRRDKGFRGKLSAEQRMIIASRIAYLMVFSNHADVQTDRRINVDDSESDDAAGHILLRDLGGGIEHIQGYDVTVNEKALEETLNTGLFIAQGSELFGWAHHRYTEFLATWYLVQHTIPLSQIMDLLLHPGGPEKRLIPQLHETAAWIAMIRPDVLEQIMHIDPEVLLRSDVTTAEERVRAKLVETLLHLQDDARQLHLQYNFSSFYWKLNHSGLSSQLSPYIQDHAANESIRMLAIDIATACKLRSLQHILVDIVLNAIEPLLIRIESAHAIIHFGDEETKAKLKPLAIEIREDDPDDDLKGCAFQAIWPRHLTAKELFNALAPPKQPHHIGTYQRFLQSHFVTHLQPVDISVALSWVEERVSHSNGRFKNSVFFPLTHDILLLAWKHLEVSGVLEAFARVVVTSVNRYAVVEDQHDLELIQVCADENKRRCVLVAALRECVLQQSDPLHLYDYKPRLILQQDIFWLIEYLSQTESEELNKAVARLIRHLINRDTTLNDGLMYAVCIASQQSPSLASELSWLLGPVILGSPEAEQMKKKYERDMKQEEQLLLLSQRANTPSMEHIALLLDECEQGKIFVWNQVCWELIYRPDGTPYQNELSRNEFPGWDVIDDAMRFRMITTAKKFAQCDDSDLASQIDNQRVLDPLFVAYKTLHLLAREVPSFLFELPVERWKQFLPSLMRWCFPEQVETDQILISRAYQVIPDQFIQTMLILIDLQGKSDQEPRIIQTMECCWDDRLAVALTQKAKDENLGLASLECLLRTLLQHQVNEAREFALSLVELPLVEEQAIMRALIAAKLLLRYADDAGWPVIWSVMQSNEDYGMKLVAKFAQSFSGWVPPQLTEEQLSDLYIWFVLHYPPSQYPIHSDASFVGFVDGIALWGNTLIDNLSNRGTFEACKAIQKIADELPELDQFTLRWRLLRVQELARRNTWKPIQPKELLKIVSDNQLRLVQSGEQLLEVVIESLKRLQAKFHDELPAWQDVWDQVIVEKVRADFEGKSQKKRKHQPKKYRPKDENEFSNRVARHLREDLGDRGIIINREVVIRKRERTDIYVDAVIHNSRKEVYDAISIIIEVKGCWNDELNIAMEEQLVGRYLKDNHCHYGLYLIGWFNCDQWDKGDYREKKSPKMVLEEAQSRFDAQAVTLSQDGLMVKAYVLDATVRE